MDLENSGNEADKKVQKFGLFSPQDELLRVLVWPASEANEVHLVRRKDTRRLEFLASLQGLEFEKIKFDDYGKVERNQVANEQAIAGLGVLRPLKDSEALNKNILLKDSSSQAWKNSIGLVAFSALIGMSIILTRPLENQKIQQELKQQVVQIVKKIPVKQQVAQTKISQTETPTQPIPKTNKTAAIKRMGALSVLGSLSSGKQRGGLNLGAANTTAGPGLGGTEGSGGAQTSIYAKGLVSAPLGAGGNMQGGGGYGTKGKGGGQAGYGKISMVGSAGTSPIPLGREAIVDGGLDRDLIADVVNKNMGQIRFCYEQGLQGDPALAGRVAIGWIIGGNGQVKTAQVENTSLNSKLVEDCILLRLKTWKFPLPEGGSDVKVSFPFVLRRTGQG